jgi:hypothetical protein
MKPRTLLAATVGAASITVLSVMERSVRGRSGCSSGVTRGAWRQPCGERKSAPWSKAAGNRKRLRDFSAPHRLCWWQFMICWPGITMP